MGRRTPATPFEQFCARLSRTCLGSVLIEPSIARALGAPQAWLTPVRPEDVAHARALCQEFRVALMLDGGKHPTACTQATLWVSPQPAGATFSLVASQASLWRADAGCTVEQLKETGVFAGMSLAPELTLAQWFAWPETVRGAVSGERERRCPPGSSLPDAARLIEQAEVMLADGTVEVLGPFGATAQAPLRSLTVQRLVPKLFELASSDAAQCCAQLTAWPACYRLDALIATPTHEPNLAQLLFGHQGKLGWVQALWLKQPGAVFAPLGLAPDTERGRTRDSEQVRGYEAEQQRASAHQFDTRTFAQTRVDPEIVSRLASHLDQELKHILDPAGVFGSNSLLKGLESVS